MTNSRYVVKSPKDVDNSVEVWSSVRLPFEPKGWLLDLRNEIRSAVKKVQGTDDAMLHAQYVSAQEDFCDVENVLLYNVGPAAFNHLCRQGLSFERGFAEPPQVRGSVGMPHYHRYSLTGLTDKPQYWVKGDRLAEWAGIECPPFRSDNKPHSFWYAMKQAAVNTIGEMDIPRYFGMELTINAPRNSHINLPSVIKPLLDGVICVLHAHDGTGNSVIVGRLAKHLGENESIVEELLMDRRHAVLGTRHLLHPFRQGIQWNPADDLCVTAKILLNDSMEDGIWSLDGEIFAVTPSGK